MSGSIAGYVRSLAVLAGIVFSFGCPGNNLIGAIGSAGSGAGGSDAGGSVADAHGDRSVSGVDDGGDVGAPGAEASTGMGGAAGSGSGADGSGGTGATEAGGTMDSSAGGSGMGGSGGAAGSGAGGIAGTAGIGGSAGTGGRDAGDVGGTAPPVMAFMAAMNFPAGNFPTRVGLVSVAIGDLNGDGKADLAIANDARSSPSGTKDDLSLLMNTGDGHFTAASQYAVGGAPQAVAIGDLNRDGRNDVITAGGGGLKVLLGKGDGTFAVPETYPTDTTPDSLAIGDLNGDGALDLVAVGASSSVRSNTVSVLWNKTNGTFAPAVNYAATRAANANALEPAVAVADVNGDSKIDIVVAVGAASASSTGEVSVLLNNGDGSFAAPAGFPTGLSGMPTLAVGDLDGDGRADVVVGDGQTTKVLLNHGDGTFDSGTSYATGSAVTIGDLDGDGKPDLAMTNYATGNAAVLMNQGAGMFAPAIEYTAGTGGFGTSIAGGDLNGDGKFDVVVANHDGGDVSILLNRGNGALVGAAGSAHGAGIPFGRAPASMAAGDMNGDGKLDLASANGAVAADGSGGDVSVLLNDGSGTFGTALNYVAGKAPMALAIGDLNGDDRPDLAVANNESGDVSVLLNDGSGRLAPATSYGAGSAPTSVALGDLNGDRRLDLVVTNRDSRNVSVLMNDGQGAFTAAVNYAVGDRPKSVAIADLNHDGSADLVVANSGSGNVSVLFNDGQGVFAAAMNYPAVDSSSTYPSCVALGDLNGDGSVDLALANLDLSGNVNVFLNTGNGVFAPAVSYATGGSSDSVAIGDLDGDGALDLATTSSGAVGVLVRKGGGTFAPAVNFGAGRGHHAVVLGDLNGDGKADISVAAASGVNVLVNASH